MGRRCRACLLFQQGQRLASAGQLDGDDEPGVGVEGGDVSLVELDGATGDGEAEPNAAARAAAVPLDAEERLEDVAEGLARHARPVVADGELRPVAMTGELDLDDAVLRRVPDGIAQDVLAGAAEQLAVARDDNRPLAGQREPAADRVSLEGTIGDELMKELAEVNVLEDCGRRGPPRPG